MFTRHKMYKDGFESQCKYCDNPTAKFRRHRAVAAVLLALMLGGLAQAQTPEHLGDTYVQRAVVQMSPNSSRAAVYFDKGFGEYPITLTSATNWQLTVGQAPYMYALFRIRDGGELSDDYWVCERQTWTNYTTTQNVANLKAASWQFARFTLTSDYTPPDFVMPIVWAPQTTELIVGYAADNTLIVVRRQDDTWEWTVRGTAGTSTWTAAATREQARADAQNFFGGPE